MHSVCERLTPRIRTRSGHLWTPRRDPPQGGSRGRGLISGTSKWFHHRSPGNLARAPRPRLWPAPSRVEGSRPECLSLTPSRAKSACDLSLVGLTAGHPPGGARCRRAGPGRGEDGRRRSRPVEGAPPGPGSAPAPAAAPQAGRPRPPCHRVPWLGGAWEGGGVGRAPAACRAACMPPTPLPPHTPLPKHSRHRRAEPPAAGVEVAGRTTERRQWKGAPSGTSPPGSSCSSALS